jgi:type VI secretion system FHA domain protein
MNLILRIIDSHNFDPNGNNIKEFHQRGGSIGRADNNDFVLVDHEKSISKLHAFVHYRNDQYYLTDVSTNGVFFNEEDVALAESVDNPRIIHEGDQIRMGNYLLQASLEENAEVMVSTIETSGEEQQYLADIEALLSSSDSGEAILPKQSMRNNNQRIGQFGGFELHNQFGVETTAREAKHVAGDLSIDDFLNEGFNIDNLPSDDASDLLDLDVFAESKSVEPVITPNQAKADVVISDNEKIQRITELTQQLATADMATRKILLTEINRLSK